MCELLLCLICLCETQSPLPVGSLFIFKHAPLRGRVVYLSHCAIIVIIIVVIVDGEKLLYTAAMIQAPLPIPYFHAFYCIQQCPPYTSHDHPPLPILWPLDPTCHITWLLALHRATSLDIQLLTRLLHACSLFNKPRQGYSLAFLFLLTSQKNRTLAYNKADPISLGNSVQWHIEFCKWMRVWHW